MWMFVCYIFNSRVLALKVLLISRHILKSGLADLHNLKRDRTAYMHCLLTCLCLIHMMQSWCLCHYVKQFSRPFLFNVKVISGCFLKRTQTKLMTATIQHNESKRLCSSRSTCNHQFSSCTWDANGFLWFKCKAEDSVAMNGCMDERIDGYTGAEKWGFWLFL